MRPVNLLPGDQRRRAPRAGDGKLAYVALGVLAVLLLMVAGYVLTANKATNRKNDAAAARAQADRLEAAAQSNASYASFAQVAQARAQAVAEVARTRFDWERFMRELALIMPHGSWLETTNASVNGDTSSLGGSSTAPGATSTATPTPGTSTTPMADLVGCTPHQSDVARMMVRLRQAYRVTDVSLNQSAQETPDQAPKPDSCGRFYKFDISVTFSASSPSERPLGQNRVPASLGGGS
jgi:Tfp pilus assembly protein PilN